MNLTVTSRGRQFDRLALMYLNDIEVFRTSTAEPTIDGIIWTYTKDVSSFLSLWEARQKIIFDLGNLVDGTYTGLFNTTLTATFFIGPDLDPAHLILPVSASKSTSNASSHFVLPETKALATLSLPRNAHRALISLSVAGQAAEEFWWANVPSPYTQTFPTTGELYGFSPFRLAILYIDSLIAGYSSPFPVIFTGGVVPALWRPIAGPDAFDLRDAYIDVSPFLGLLSDGLPHRFEIKIAGLDRSELVEEVGASWFVSGKILLWLDDDSDAITTGEMPVIIAPPPLLAEQQQLIPDRNGNNESLIYSTDVSQSLSVSSIIKSKTGGSRSVQWTQTAYFHHESHFSGYGERQELDYRTDSLDTAVHSGSGADAGFKVQNQYGLVTDTNMTFYPTEPHSNLTIEASLAMSARTHRWNQIPGTPHRPGEEGGSYSDTKLQGRGYYFSDPKTKTGLSFGNTEQTFESRRREGRGNPKDGYERIVDAVNGTVVTDREVLDGKVLRDFADVAGHMVGTDDSRGDGKFGSRSARQLLGRGPC